MTGGWPRQPDRHDGDADATMRFIADLRTPERRVAEAYAEMMLGGRPDAHELRIEGQIPSTGMSQTARPAPRYGRNSGV